MNNNPNSCSGMCAGGCVLTILLIIGGLNWGLIGLGGFFGGNWNVVNILLGSWPTVESIAYILVGISAIWRVISCNKCCGGMCPVGKKM